MAQSFVVVGAYGGIGEALCRRLAGRGARVLMAGRDPDKLARLAADIGGETVALDAAQPDQVEACLRRAAELFGRLDGVANCVGSLLLKPAHAISVPEWQSTIETNLGSAFAVVRAAGLVMALQGGSVVLMSSAAARIGLANHEAIAAAKAGIEGLALSAAATYAPKGIRVNCVAPGLTRTPLTARLWQQEAAAKGSASLHALGRLGAPEEVASAIDWLLDLEQAWVTGQVIGVDGGLSRGCGRGPDHMEASMNTHIISGSHRAPSQSAKVAHYLAARIEATGGQASVTELANNALPLWDEGMWSGDPKWTPLWSPIEDRLRAADSLIVVVPEYAGMAAAAAKNLFLFCGGDPVAHKPTLLVAVSSGLGGSYPIAEMRASSYKNSRQLYLPEHVIVREAEKVLNGETIGGPNDEYIRARIEYALRMLAQYQAAMNPIRESGTLMDPAFRFGM